MRDMEDLYETKITDARWMAYDIPGNIGWITYLVCLTRTLKRGLSLFAILALFPAVLMLVGIAELISERIAKLDRVLPRRRLLRGFGALTLGGMIGSAVSLGGIIVRADDKRPYWMLVGSVLCAVFAGLCYKGYKKNTQESSFSPNVSR